MPLLLAAAILATILVIYKRSVKLHAFFIRTLKGGKCELSLLEPGKTDLIHNTVVLGKPRKCTSIQAYDKLAELSRISVTDLKKIRTLPELMKTALSGVICQNPDSIRNALMLTNQISAKFAGKNPDIVIRLVCRRHIFGSCIAVDVKEQKTINLKEVD